MEAIPQTQPTWALLALIAICFVSVTLILAIRRSPEAAQTILKLLAIGVALAVGIGFFWRTSSQTPISNMASPRSVPEIREAAKLNEINVAKAVTSRPSDDAASSDLSAPELPGWTRQPRGVDGKRTLLVVKSGRFAALDEAELTAFDEAAKSVAQEFRDLDPRGIGDRFIAQIEMVRQSAVKRRFDEVTEHDFGKLGKTPMYQVWLQVELTPELGEQIAAPWRQAAVEARLRTLTGWSVWGTAAAALLSIALRLDSAWNGRRRVVIVGTTIVLALGSLAFLA